MIEDAAGSILSVGRKTRSIPSALKRALVRRDQDRCRYPGCNHRAFLEGHHIEHWADGGETSLANIVLMCSYHHRFLHEYRFAIVLDARGCVQFFDPDGELVEHDPARPATDATASWSAIRDRNRDLDITAATNECGWDGRGMDLGVVVDDLLRAIGE